MKNESQAILTALSKKEITALCTQVSETALTDKQAKKFTAADLWYIHKNKKTSSLKASAF